MKKFTEYIAGLKTCLAFVLHLVALVFLFLIAMKDGADVGSYMVWVLVSYMGGRSATQISAFMAASKDPNCDTESVVNKVNEK